MKPGAKAKTQPQKRSPLLANAMQAHQAGRLDEARQLYQTVLKNQPRNAEAIHFLGVLEYQRKNYDDAIALMERSLRFDECNRIPAWHSNLGLALNERGRSEEAVSCYERALRLKEAYPEAHINLGIALLRLGKSAVALDSFRRALALNPRSHVALNGLGASELKQGNVTNAIEHLCAALELAPDYADAHNNLAGAYRSAGRLKDAFRHQIEALRLRRDASDLHSNYLIGLQYTPGVPIEKIYSEHVTYGERFTGRATSNLANTPDPNRRLKIGYVSPDLRQHPVGYFLTSVLATHNRQQFEIHCYSDVLDEDNYTAIIQSAVDHWHPAVGLSHTELAARVRAEQIDILIDLAGHTKDNRLPMFAERAAPVQTTWMGYFNTTGLKAMDYLIADATVAPPQGPQRFTENVVRLPESYLCYTLPDYAPPVGPLPFAANGYITFGCFNNAIKVNHDVAALWAQILHRCEGARLLLKNAMCGDTNWRKGFAEQFAALGIATDRLLFEGASPHDKLFATYGQVDIALDPFPYSGGTTTCEALAMGVPVITLAGESFVSRVSTSFVTAIGLGDLACATPEQYVEKAVALAGDRERLAELRAGMRERMAASSLGDKARFTGQLEDAYRNMWRRWCATLTLESPEGQSA